LQKANSSAGFTLLEVLLALAILGVVLAAGFSIYSLGHNTYNRAEVQSDLQHDTLKVSQFITQALHNATEVQILSSASDVPAVVNDDYKYIYLYQMPGTTVDSVVFKDKNGLTSLVNQNCAGNGFELEFESRNSGKVCYFKINGTNVPQSYAIDSSIKLPNTTVSSALLNGSVLKLKISAWSNMKIQGIGLDDTVILTEGVSVASDDSTWAIFLSNAAFKDKIFSNEDIVINLPDGLHCTASRDSTNVSTLIVTVTGTANTPVTGEQSVSVFINPSAVEEEASALASDAITLKLVPGIGGGPVYYEDSNGNRQYVTFDPTINTIQEDPNWTELVITSDAGSQTYPLFDYYAPKGITVESGVQLTSNTNVGSINLATKDGDIVIDEGVKFDSNGSQSSITLQSETGDIVLKPGVQFTTGGTANNEHYEIVIKTGGNIYLEGVDMSAIRYIALTAGQNIYGQNAELTVDKNKSEINLILTSTDGHIYIDNLYITGDIITATPYSSLSGT
jgi:prepilin-type N-terminal cleavage/methylation domain-containing protein